MSRRALRITWISIGSTLALLASASLVVGILLHDGGNPDSESLALLAKVLLAFSAASFVILAVSLRRWKAPAAAEVADTARTTRRPVSKVSRYIRGIFQGFGAFALAIIGLLVLTRGNKAGIIIIAIGIVFALSALINFWLAERTSRAAAADRSAGRS
jgi:hypothetical protein